MAAKGKVRSKKDNFNFSTLFPIGFSQLSRVLVRICSETWILNMDFENMDSQVHYDALFLALQADHLPLGKIKTDHNLFLYYVLFMRIPVSFCLP